jgi:hypothetical protein
MPNERGGDPGNRGSTIANLAQAAGPGSVDGRHLLLVGAGQRALHVVVGGGRYWDRTSDLSRVKRALSR